MVEICNLISVPQLIFNCKHLCKMAFKIVCVLALIAIANAGVLLDTVQIAQNYAAPFTYSDTAVGSTQEKVVRSFDGTVSHYSKSVDTPFSSVRKTDTRVNNKVYTPVAYHADVPVTYHAAPIGSSATSTAYHVPSIDALHYQAAPVAYSSPIKTLQPIQYSHPAPVNTAYQTNTLSFSPAEAVAHVSFAGLGTHYEW